MRMAQNAWISLLPSSSVSVLSFTQVSVLFDCVCPAFPPGWYFRFLESSSRTAQLQCLYYVCLPGAVLHDHLSSTSNYDLYYLLSGHISLVVITFCHVKGYFLAHLVERSVKLVCLSCPPLNIPYIGVSVFTGAWVFLPPYYVSCKLDLNVIVKFK